MHSTPSAAPSIELDPAHRLSDLMHLAAYAKTRAHIFPSVESLRWFVRRNRSLLIEHGAIAAPTGCLMVDAPAMDLAVIEIGRARVLP